jgi:hypothetical protein
MTRSTKAMGFIKSFQGNEGGFGYTGPENRVSLTGVGVLCTYFWKQDKDRVVREGIDFLLGKSEVKYKSDKCDLYAWYYSTQACQMFGGSAWMKWNRMFQNEIAGSQSPDGSWPPTQGGHLQPNPGGAGPYYRTTLLCPDAGSFLPLRADRHVAITAERMRPSRVKGASFLNHQDVTASGIHPTRCAPS